MRRGPEYLFVAVASVWAALGASAVVAQSPSRPSILLITADDLNWDSVGCYGSEIPDITPNIDRLAASGVRFERGHVTISLCQPSRTVWMTGRYPHRTGVTTIRPVDKTVATLPELLRDVGYHTGILGKVIHLQPPAKFPWDHVVVSKAIGEGRSPAGYYQSTRKFLQEAKGKGKPFFLMANAVDPHRPFAGQSRLKKTDPESRDVRRFAPADVDVPAFLPDLPSVRQELAHYFSSVDRCDRVVGNVLLALEEEGLEKDTIVVFMSDNGMSFPFAKGNCYLDSTKVPIIVRWPGELDPGRVDRDHYISGVDVMPTLLDLIGVSAADNLDGRTFAPLLRGEVQTGRDTAVTMFYQQSGVNFGIRCIHHEGYGYLFNAWKNGLTEFRSDWAMGRAFRAMRDLAIADQVFAPRFRHLLLERPTDELYDFDQDTHAMNNLATGPEHAGRLADLQSRLLEFMEQVEDPLLEAFQTHLSK